MGKKASLEGGMGQVSQSHPGEGKAARRRCLVDILAGETQPPGSR